MALININKLKESASKALKDASEWTSQATKDASEWTSQAAKDASDWTSKAAKDASDLTSQAVKNASDWSQQAFLDATDWTKQAVVDVKETATLLATDEETQRKVLSATIDAAQKTGKITVKGLKVVSGVQAVQDRKKSITNKEEADQLKAEIEATNEVLRDDLNETLDVFGKQRLRALKRTIGTFLRYLERMNQRSKTKEYDFLSKIDIKQENLKEMKHIDMQASQAAKVLAVGGGFAAVGLIGTPAAVTAAVTAVGAASTGTAISALSGAAASNAVLAWLGWWSNSGRRWWNGGRGGGNGHHNGHRDSWPCHCSRRNIGIGILCQKEHRE